MKILWQIAKKDLFHVLKDRNAFILLLIVPILLISILGAVFSNEIGEDAKPSEFTVAVHNEDHKLIGNVLIKALQARHDNFKINIKDYRSAAQILQQVSSQNAVVGLVIPAQTTEKVTDAAIRGQAIQNIIKFYVLPNSNDQRIVITEQVVTSVLNHQIDMLYTGSAAVQQIKQVLLAHCQDNGGQERGTNNKSGERQLSSSTSVSGCPLDMKDINAAAVSKAVSEASPTGKSTSLVQLLPTGTVPKVNAFDRSMPGFAILFALFGLNTAAGSILQEKDDGTFRRLIIAPVPRYALLGGKLIAQFVLTLLQLALLFLTGVLLFKLDIGNWLAVALLLISTGVATTGLGMLLVSVLKTRRQLPVMVTLVTLITSTIGGSWWPLWSEPQWMQQLAKIGITAWALEGLNGVMIFGQSLAEVKWNIVGLLGYGLICFLLALRLFHFQEKTI